MLEHRFLGASNLWIARRQLVQAAAPYGPARLSIAAGPGRSYGQTAGNPLVRYPSLLASPMFEPLEARQPGFAVLTDVGNDIAYGVEPERLLDWVSTAVEHLRTLGFQIALSRLPLVTLAKLPDLLFHLIGLFFFGRIGVDRAQLFERLVKVDEGLQALAFENSAVVLECHPDWFGWDGFHLKGRARRDCWECWFERLFGSSPKGPEVAESRTLARGWRTGLWQVQLSAGERKERSFSVSRSGTWAS